MFKRQQHDQQAAATLSPQARRAQLEAFLEAARHAEGLGPGDGRIPVPLKRGERMLFTVQGAALVEPRRDRGHWEGRNQGVSIRVPGTRSMRYRIGSTHGTYVQGTEQPTVIDTGTFTITTQRACFSGAKQTREWAWSKLVGVTHDSAMPWSAISVSNRQKTSGVLYDREHTDLIRFWLDLAIARATDNTPTLIHQLEGELATLGPAPPEGGVPSAQPSAPAPSASTPRGPAHPAGWYADPAGRFTLRYWDGSLWTQHVSHDGKAATDPLV